MLKIPLVSARPTARDATMEPHCPAMRICLFGMRSARTPPKRESVIPGMALTSAIEARIVAEPVSR